MIGRVALGVRVGTCCSASVGLPFPRRSSRHSDPPECYNQSQEGRQYIPSVRTIRRRGGSTYPA
eukprot:5180834-Pyramimonas_sp.AAC.1